MVSQNPCALPTDVSLPATAEGALAPAHLETRAGAGSRVPPAESLGSTPGAPRRRAV